MSGDNRHSGTMLWPGSAFTYQNTSITFRETNSSMDFSARVNTTIFWILHEETPANLVFLYFDEPDWAAHMNGPDSERMDMQLIRLNGITEYLLYKLQKHGLTDRVSLIFVSDHGMTTIAKENQMDFRQFLDNEVYIACGESPYWYINVSPGNHIVYVSPSIERSHLVGKEITTSVTIYETFTVKWDFFELCRLKTYSIMRL